MADGGWKVGFFLLLFFLVLWLVAIVAYFFSQGKLPLPQSKTQNSPTPALATPLPSADLSTGIIEGSLSYPGEGIPETMKICAENQQTKETSCTNKQLKNDKYQYGVGYQLEVPAGSYAVYAFLSDNPEQKAYYSKAVPCGLTVACTDHEPILVTINAGEVAVNIDPQDWYAPAAGAQVNEDALIKQAIYTKTGLSEAQAEVTISQNTGNHAKGGIKEYDAVGGAYWLAAKTSDGWVGVYDGQANPECATIEPYNFPTSMVPECQDAGGNVVSR